MATSSPTEAGTIVVYHTYNPGTYTISVITSCGTTPSQSITIAGSASPPPTTQSRPTYSQSSSAFSATQTSESCNIVNPSEHIMLCVPYWLSGSVAGSATVTDSSGNSQPFSGSLPLHSSLSTGSGSYASVKDDDAGSTFSLAPLSNLISYFRGYYDATQGEVYTCENSPQSCDLVAGRVISDALSEALDAAYEGNLPQAWYKLGHGVYDMWQEVGQGIAKVADCVSTPEVWACHLSGSNAEVMVGDNGTRVEVVSGEFAVVNSANGQFATLSAGQDVFVSSNLTQAGGQNMSRSVLSFDPNTVNHWWSSSGPTSSSGINMSVLLEFLVPSLVFVSLVLVAVTYALRRTHVRYNRRQAATRGSYTSSYCRYCGSPRSPQAQFCNQCGRKL